MQEKGLEPSWYCYHTDLNRARLPIPPFLHTNDILPRTHENVNPYFSSELLCRTGNSMIPPLKYWKFQAIVLQSLIIFKLFQKFS